jgi:hypothetical protein
MVLNLVVGTIIFACSIVFATVSLVWTSMVFFLGVPKSI